jgi:hypothetical protein
MFSNEVWFYWNRQVNWHKIMYWTQDSPHVAGDAYHQTNTRTTVWYMVHGNPLLAPVIPDSIVNNKQYLKLLSDVLD